jgi:Ca2+-binding RTX toxin-like protein
VTGADVFPYPPDDPTVIQGMVTALDGMAGGVAGVVETVRRGRGSLATLWVSPAGTRAVNEVDAVAGIGDSAMTALADAQAPLAAYAGALDDVRAAIDTLRRSYDDAVADYEAALASAAGHDPDDPAPMAQLEDARVTHEGTLSGLKSQYFDLISGLDTTASNAAGTLTGIAGRISPAPESRNPDLVRASVLDTLPFMASHEGTTIVRTDHGIIVDTGLGDDDVRISRDPATGETIVVVNGQTYRFSAQEAGDLVIRTNGGSDVIEVEPGMRTGITMLGGWGEDLIAGGAGNDTVNGGPGADHLVGGRGADVLVGEASDDHISDGLSFAGSGILAVQFGGRYVAPRQGEGADLVVGGAGDDDIDTGQGHDTIYAGDGDDVVAAGAGDDEIHGGEGADRIHGGDGHDTITGDQGNDEVHGGEGADWIDAGDGDDYVDAYRGDDTVFGRGGDDVLYAGEGHDFVDGGAGRDYVDGYLGDDTLAGGSGDDVLSGGAGQDHLYGDGGDDAMYTGAGRDEVYDHAGHNSIYHQGDDVLDVGAGDREVTVEVVALPSNIRIEGSPEFVARARADLETLAASPVGRQLLQRIGDEGALPPEWGGDTLTIRETHEKAGYAKAGDDNEVEVLYNPTTHITFMQHELTHAYNFMSDTMVGTDGGAHFYLGPDARQAPPGVDADKDGRVSFAEVDRDHDGDIDDHDLDLNGDGQVTDDGDGWTENSERQAVGLPVDHDHNPSTPDVPASQVVDHPDDLTENGLRREMGLPMNETY